MVSTVSKYSRHQCFLLQVMQCRVTQSRTTARASRSCTQSLCPATMMPCSAVVMHASSVPLCATIPHACTHNSVHTRRRTTPVSPSRPALSRRNSTTCPNPPCSNLRALNRAAAFAIRYKIFCSFSFMVAQMIGLPKPGYAKAVEVYENAELLVSYAFQQRFVTLLWESIHMQKSTDTPAATRWSPVQSSATRPKYTGTRCVVTLFYNVLSPTYRRTE